MDRYGTLIAYNNWANRRTIEQVKSLSVTEFNKELGGSFPSVRLTLTHLLISDWLWLNRWQGKPIVSVPTDWDTTSADAIDMHWASVQQEIELFTNALIPDGQDRAITFTTLKGDTYQLPLWQTINHVVNHGTYHRGQITNMVRILGHKPVSTDMFLFFNENQTSGN